MSFRRPRNEDAGTGPASPASAYVAIDGGMIFVDGRWQKVQLGCVFRADDRVDDARRPALTARQVVAVRGTPEALAARRWSRVGRRRRDRRPPDGGAGGRRAVARVLYGDGTPKAAQWRRAQLDWLWTDGVDQVIESVRFLGPHQRTAAKRQAVAGLHRYLTTNGDRMRCQTFRNAGDQIGSGAVESAVSHVVQQRMKRVGMCWRAPGADAMLALRSVYRSTGAWKQFWAARRAARTDVDCCRLHPRCCTRA